MATTPCFYPHFVPLRARNQTETLLFLTPRHHKKKRSFTLQALASSLALPINVDYLQSEFSGHGATFQEIGNSCVVKMGLENGSVAALMLPSGLITSYKPSMWHGATTELLHTTVVEGEDGEAIIQGGVSMDLSCAVHGGLHWSSDNWALLDVRGSSQGSIQLELISIAPKDLVQVKCVVTLQQDYLGSEITVTNPRSTSLQLLGAVYNHLTVSTPDASYVIGLLGSGYHNKQPIVSDFSIIPPDSGEEKSVSMNPLARKGFDGLFSGWNEKRKVQDEELGDEGEEDDDFAHMTEKMCRIYTSVPREFTIMDRGRRNSVVIRRNGFEEFYVFSPGSEHEWYGKYAFLCIGTSALLKPVVLGPEGSWTGAQYLYNPNL